MGYAVADQSGGVPSLFLQSKDDIESCSDREGGQGLRLEVRDGLTSDGALMVVQGDDSLGSVLELLDGGIGKDESASDKEHKIQKGTELDSPVMAGALGVLTGPQAEVESQDDQVGDVSGFWIG